ncbi:hypothetical protein M413DRAFT_448594 [Hebeloma cylindrosporum]|uniref:Uncharacterized protein n=1 Tax=Hebeloma cylindrosporum TaxID=76867 RepID=A0A0C2Y8F0_HEBCY|nr:hypothetical protein M413DRAFT_448594 [Hebeloma cylindrosporum h7]
MARTFARRQAGLLSPAPTYTGTFPSLAGRRPSLPSTHAHWNVPKLGWLFVKGSEEKRESVLTNRPIRACF